MSELLKIVNWVKQNAAVGNVAIARMSLRVGEDVSKITDASAGDAAKIEKFKKAAADIVGKPYA